MSADRGRARSWMIFLRERAPLPALLAVGAAPAISAAALFGAGFHAGAIALAASAVAALLVLMRLMDEVKDFAKDLVAHPTRPLPRGLVPVPSARRAIASLGLALLVVAAGLAIARGAAIGGLYAGCVAYTGLMYREFYLPRTLGRNAFVYALTHQIIVLPIYAFTVAAVSPADALSAPTLWFALTGLGASFTFEIARKLDPLAPRILGTYLIVHGRDAAVAAIVAALALLAVSAWQIGVAAIVWPGEALVLATLPSLYRRPDRYRFVQGAAALLAVAQMLAPALRRAWTVFP